MVQPRSHKSTILHRKMAHHERILCSRWGLKPWTSSGHWPLWVGLALSLCDGSWEAYQSISAWFEVFLLVEGIHPLLKSTPLSDRPGRKRGWSLRTSKTTNANSRKSQVNFWVLEPFKRSDFPLQEVWVNWGVRLRILKSYDAVIFNDSLSIWLLYSPKPSRRLCGGWCFLEK